MNAGAAGSFTFDSKICQNEDNFFRCCCAGMYVMGMSVFVCAVTIVVIKCICIDIYVMQMKSARSASIKVDRSVGLFPGCMFLISLNL